jgi:hypothetical protein
MPPVQPLSLLWPPGRGSVTHFRLGDDAVADLNVDALIKVIVSDAASAGRTTAREHFARGSEVGLLLGVARLIEQLRRAGLPVCAPECAAPGDRSAELLEAYDPELALTQPSDAVPVVTNDIRFDAQLGRVWVLTGPNRGGKTTYTRAAGLAQVLFQAGMGDAIVASLIADSVDGDASGGSADSDASGGSVDGDASGASAVVRRRTYRILPSQPRGVSFAAEIAEEHGISYPQLARLLRERQLG